MDIIPKLNINRQTINIYTILIKKTSPLRNRFESYSEIAEGEKSTAEFQTDDLIEFAEKYKKLLNIYSALQMKAVQELDTEILVNIIDE